MDGIIYVRFWTFCRSYISKNPRWCGGKDAIIIDRTNEQREKAKFFRQYRDRWAKIFGKMSMKQENELWEMWIRPNEKT